MNEYDIIIAGAGPAGLFCGANLCGGRNILILERNPSAGEKLLLSGSGRCNITHAGSPEDFLLHYGGHGAFVKPALRAFGNVSLIRFLEENGVGTVEREDGKIFPASMNAHHVRDLLLELCRENGVAIRYGERIISAEKKDAMFTIKTGKGGYSSGFFVIAAGGKSYSSTGSSGDGYTMAEGLGHTITDITPSLTPVFIKDPALADLAGISIGESTVVLFRDGKRIASGRGGLLFTGKGLSGPVILDMSRYIERGDVLKVSLAPLPPDALERELAAGLQREGKKAVRTILPSLDVPRRLVNAALGRAGIDPLKKGSEISRVERKSLVTLLSEFPFTVHDKGDYRVAMATSGGVSLDGIDRRTMESKLRPGLFFAGEVIDIDGDTGGYNLQWAFSSGKAAADAINRKCGG